MDKIRVLQLGNRDWRKLYTLPKILDFQYRETLEEVPDPPYDIIFLDRTPSREEIDFLYQGTKAYTLFVTENVKMEGDMARLYNSRKGKNMEEADIQKFLLWEARNYFPKPYGEKFNLRNLAIVRDFSGSIRWKGGYSVCLEGDFGNEQNQIVFWRNNIPLEQGQCLDLWLEYKKDKDVELSLSVTLFAAGTISNVQKKWKFSEEDLEHMVQIENPGTRGNLFVSLFAKGTGKLEIITLHDRYSRRGHGHFLPGGERYVTSDREELFCYFDPGDMKPPFNVYFSGYKTREGFEGYNLMRSMGCPFLLVAEARLEGGCFYMGSEEYEKMIVEAIRGYMKELGFTGDQVILSGLSMGTFGALYYGCDLGPHAMILGKPLASIGTVAAGEKMVRPGGFPTSLDILKYLCRRENQEAIEELNARFWDKFDHADWSASKFIISYMIEDDYDASAYSMLLSHLHSAGVQVYGKGIHGRHNDNTGGIVSWFSSQFEKILTEDFHRRIKK